MAAACAFLMLGGGIIGFWFGYSRGSLGGYKRGIADAIRDDKELHREAVIRLAKQAAQRSCESIIKSIDGYLEEMERQSK